MVSATSSQKASRSSSGRPLFDPATIPALTAPMEVPATMSNFMPRLASALNTPHSYAPNEPPPCITSTVSDCSFCLFLIFSSWSVKLLILFEYLLLALCNVDYTAVKLSVSFRCPTWNTVLLSPHDIKGILIQSTRMGTCKCSSHLIIVRKEEK